MFCLDRDFHGAGGCETRRARPLRHASAQVARREEGAKSGQARMVPSLIGAALLAAIPWLADGKVEASGRPRLEFGVTMQR